MVKVLVSDPIEKEGLSPLIDNPKFSVTIKTGMKPDELLKEISASDVLLVRSETKVTPGVLESASNLKRTIRDMIKNPQNYIKIN